jgi:hypothetical protein
MDNSDKITLHCLPILAGIKQTKKQPYTHESVYQEGELEHPALPGTMLTLDQRLCSVSLEFSDSDGVIRLETLDEKRFRIFWKKPIPFGTEIVKTEEEKVICPECKKQMVIRSGPRGKFFGCSQFPKCQKTMSI